MTSIVYYDGGQDPRSEGLYADKKTLTFGGTFHKVGTGKKLRLSHCRRVAFGRTGGLLTDAESAEVFGYLIEKILPDRKLQHFTAPSATFAKMFNHMLVMTTDRVFCMAVDDDQISIEDDHFTVGIGSGGLLVAGALTGGLAPDEAYREVAKYDDLTGAIYTRILRSSLRPME